MSIEGQIDNLRDSVFILDCKINIISQMLEETNIFPKEEFDSIELLSKRFNSIWGFNNEEDDISEAARGESNPAAKEFEKKR